MASGNESKSHIAALCRVRSSIGKAPIQVSGGDRGKVTPVPIPNTAVKLVSADGTDRVTDWESR